MTVGVNQAASVNVSLTVGEIVENGSGDGRIPADSNDDNGTGDRHRAKGSERPSLNGRNFTQLLTLTQCVTPVSTSQNKSIGCCEGNVGLPGSGFADASFHGQENRSKLYFFDGIINTNIRGPTYIVIPNIDLIQEFVVTGHDAKAEFGGATGGVVNIVSKPGGNAFHGSAFEYVRNNFFDARDTFKDANKTGPAAFRENQFGAVMTGRLSRTGLFSPADTTGGVSASRARDYRTCPQPRKWPETSRNTTVGQRHNLFNPYSTRPRWETVSRETCSAAMLGQSAAGERAKAAGADRRCRVKIPQAFISRRCSNCFSSIGFAELFRVGDLTVTISFRGAQRRKRKQFSDPG